MKKGALKLLLALSEGERLEDLASRLGIHVSTAWRHVKELETAGLVDLENGEIRFKRSPKLSALLELQYEYNLEELLRDPREDILLEIFQGAKKAKELADKLNLSARSVEEHLRALRDIGVVQKTPKGYVLTESKLLKKYLELELSDRQVRSVEPYAEILYSDGKTILKRVKKDMPATGVETAFSRFNDFGITVKTPWKYLVQPPVPPTIEEILVHALLASHDKREVALCMVFYVKNRNRLNLEKVREVGKHFKILSRILDMEKYVRYGRQALNELENREIFPDWEDFTRIAETYNIKVHEVRERNLIEILSSGIKQKITIYVFGGYALLLRGWKTITKDYDILVTKRSEFEEIKKVLMKSGFHEAVKVEGKVPVEGYNSTILKSVEGERVDLFLNAVLGEILLTDSMRNRSELYVREGNLEVRLLAPEDIILLKLISGRDGDIDDIVTIFRKHRVNSKRILEELERQESILKKRGHVDEHRFCVKALKTLDKVVERGKMRPRLFDLLKAHVMRALILKALERGIVNESEVLQFIQETYGLRDIVFREDVQRHLKKIKGQYGKRREETSRKRRSIDV